MDGNYSPTHVPKNQAGGKMDAQWKIDLILDWAQDHPKFDTEFIDSVQEWINENDATDAQEQALDNIISCFRIGR